MHESLPGLMLVLLRLALTALFAFNLAHTIARERSILRKDFYQSFAIVRYCDCSVGTWYRPETDYPCSQRLTPGLIICSHAGLLHVVPSLSSAHAGCHGVCPVLQTQGKWEPIIWCPLWRSLLYCIPISEGLLSEVLL